MYVCSWRNVKRKLTLWFALCKPYLGVTMTRMRTSFFYRLLGPPPWVLAYTYIYTYLHTYIVNFLARFNTYEHKQFFLYRFFKHTFPT